MKQHRHLFLIFTILLSAFIAFGFLSMPSPKGINEEGFSAARVIEDLKVRILKREINLRCPLCGEPLITRIAKMYDLEDNLVLEPKAHCVKCVFQIKH